MSNIKKEKKNTPILVANTEWDLPEIILKEIKAERMINGLLDFACPNKLSEEDQVGWAECVGYLMPATQKSVIRNDVAEIYLYCVNKLMERRKVEVPEVCKMEKLSNYQMIKLNEMKRWIFKNRGGKENNPILSAIKEVFNEPPEPLSEVRKWKGAIISL